VTVRGGGVAAYCCAYLLNKAGFQVDLEATPRARVPVVLLGDQALALLRDIFEQPELLAATPRIRKRIVAWGENVPPVAVEHSASLISEDGLLDAIRQSPIGEGNRALPLSIYAARPLPAPAAEHCFGTRMALVSPVTLKRTADFATCWIESLDEGWLFLTPEWLLSVGAPTEILLNRSRVVAEQIAGCSSPTGAFPAYARIASPLGAPDWLACGTAAMAFDPICGDGTAQAVREAILASAVIRGIADGGSRDELVSHYEARLTAGFAKHLALCRQFYASGGRGDLWQSEVAAIDRGIAWCNAALASHPPFRYQLRGLELEAIH
jgi:hypothetical protein